MSKKVLISASSVLLLFSLLYFILPDFIQLKEERVIVTNLHIEQDSRSVETSVKEEVKIETTDLDDKAVADSVKEKFREVIEGAINFLSHDKKIVSIGDSLTEGVGDETENGGYVGILNNTFEDNELNITIENLGKRGNRTDQLLKRLDKKEIATAIKDADIVLITIGANDIMKVVRSNYTNLRIEPFQKEKIGYVERLTAIFNKINELNPDSQIYLIGFYNPFELYFSDIEQLEIILDDWNQTGKSVTEEFENVYYIPTEDLFSTKTSNLLADDNFHPNTSGYKLMAQRVIEYLNKYNEEAELPIEAIE
ncbi:SGNH/GDSL hydrolase family protein [Bacillus suaedaesalsae]|uniref:SGNH/GDSL hydrolase family protein n=1 Tax=Bacillus suaedaesalsae TaxID=2810349 RepID=A0ABS2DEB3_9BACI|nr:SGNH/GDSL hydrolase family protein [Bacillus suaedaesalsae]MBM6616802.1 SGNH/GDSL hydrolase family protein [Bacillus suaedaesalsae]